MKVSLLMVLSLLFFSSPALAGRCGEFGCDIDHSPFPDEWVTYKEHPSPEDPTGLASVPEKELKKMRKDLLVEMGKIDVLGASAAIITGALETVPFLSAAPNGFMHDELESGAFADPVLGGLVTGILEIGPALARKAAGKNMKMSAYRCVQNVCIKTWGDGSKYQGRKLMLKEVDKELALRKAKKRAPAAASEKLVKKFDYMPSHFQMPDAPINQTKVAE